MILIKVTVVQCEPYWPSSFGRESVSWSAGLHLEFSRIFLGNESHSCISYVVFEVTDEIELRDAIDESKLEGTMIVDCYADWCGPCKVSKEKKKEEG